MRGFGDAGEVYEVVGGMLRQIAGSSGFRARIETIDQVIRFDLTEPKATLTFTARSGGQPKVDQSSGAVLTDAIVEMASTDLHRLLLGRLNPFLALDVGAMRISGDPMPFLSVIPQIRQAVAPLYESRLREIGRTDLIG